jgi:3-hydroxy-9,10-secoandrosta-1,3,5(10)-triene-9,17-dione monooxygenase
MAHTQPSRPSHAPSRAEAVAAARALLPALHARVADTEARRMLPPETVADMKAAGLHKLFVPRRYGGFEMPWGTHVDVARVLGQTCASSAWVSSVVFTHTFLFGRFEPDIQEEIWGANPDAIISTGFAGGGRITPADGGFRVTGRWKFCSGVDYADVVLVGARLPESKAAAFDRWVVLKPGDFAIVDTWHSEGLRGTGSKDVKVDDVFVPAYRTLETEQMSSAPPGARLHDSYLYGVEFHSYFVTLLSGPILGAARGVLNAYLAQTRGRTGAMNGESIAEQVPVQVALGESIAELETAELISDAMCDWLETEGRARRPIVGEPKLKVRRDLVLMGRLAKSAAQRLADSMGVSAQVGDNPAQRLWRDVRTMSTHSAFNWHQHMGMSGRYRLGLKTGDPKVDDVAPAANAAA